MKTPQVFREPYIQGAMVLLASGVLLALLAQMHVYDYYLYVKAVNAWLDGSSQLYDSAGAEFYYAPWSLIILIPLSFLPHNLAQAALNLGSILGMLWVLRTLVPALTLPVIILMILSPWMLTLVYLGQWDGLVLIGIAGAWVTAHRRQPWLLGLALVLVSTKMTNVTLATLLILYSLRNWPWQDCLKMLVIPALVGLGSLAAFGWEWPLRYLRFIQATPPPAFNVSVWSLGGAWLPLLLSAGLGVWWWRLRRSGSKDHEDMLMVLLLSLLVSPFVSVYHFVITLPAHAWITQRLPRVGLLVMAYGFFACLSFILRWSYLPATLYLIGMPLLMLWTYRRQICSGVDQQVQLNTAEP